MAFYLAVRIFLSWCQLLLLLLLIKSQKGGKKQEEEEEEKTDSGLENLEPERMGIKRKYYRWMEP